MSTGGQRIYISADTRICELDAPDWHEVKAATLPLIRRLAHMRFAMHWREIELFGDPQVEGLAPLSADEPQQQHGARVFDKYVSAGATFGQLRALFAHLNEMPPVHILDDLVRQNNDAEALAALEEHISELRAELADAERRALALRARV